MQFKLTSEFQPTGDQPEAIRQLIQGLQSGRSSQVLLGVTGSGKTFTVANVINEIHRPTLILSHNKTLAAQLYGEFKSFFPENAVEYFVSYYDYYQPEAYLPTTDTYIEKDLAINDEIDKLRLRTTASLLSGRRDVIVVSSVSCLYGRSPGFRLERHPFEKRHDYQPECLITPAGRRFICKQRNRIQTGLFPGQRGNRGYFSCHRNLRRRSLPDRILGRRNRPDLFF